MDSVDAANSDGGYLTTLGRDTELLAAVFDSLIDPLVVLSPVLDGGRLVEVIYVHANAAAVRYFGDAGQTMVGKPSVEVLGSARASTMCLTCAVGCLPMCRWSTTTFCSAARFSMRHAGSTSEPPASGT